ncbi:MAG: tRNA pseudouridine(38-40) synthase TruA [Propionibacteriaceae bacterium]|jgi:tRNA pseudouridine38-40 synthase|nr:tRNA pseudouridine(38-40) synthase TruA [Propionibacteriaceae bacterium]
MTTRVRLDLAYDGAGFAGWAKQPGLRTVQGELELRLTQLLRSPEPVTLTVAGRTDAGVHARGQVAHADVPDAVTTSRGETVGAVAALRRWLPGALPPDIAVHAVTVAPAGFDARFSALWRRYVYRLADDPFALDPLERGHVVRTPPLDAAAMAEGAPALLGLHDFAAVCKRPPEGATSVRRLLEVTVTRPRPGRLDLTCRADAFCHSMVRSLTGALVAVGLGKRTPAWLATLVDRRERAGDVTVFPPEGLTLEEVAYPEDAALAARAAAAKQPRACATGSGAVATERGTSDSHGA